MSIFNVLLQSEVDSIKAELKGVVATQKTLEEKYVLTNFIHREVF